MKTRVDARGLHYFDSAARGSPLPSIVFLHAFPLDHRMWEAQIAALEGRYRVVAPDLRGQGANVPGGPLLVDFFVDDLFALQDELGIQSAVYCGLSMGGYVALRAVERDPQRCDALVLCDTRAEPDNNETKTKRADSIRLLWSGGPRQRTAVDLYLGQFLRNALGASTLSGKPESVSRIRDIASTSPESMSSALIALAARTDLTPSLSSIVVPVLILVGEEDTLTTPAEAERMRAKIPGSRLAHIPRAGHYSNLENPVAFNDEIIRFLKEVCPCVRT